MSFSDLGAPNGAQQQTVAAVRSRKYFDLNLVRNAQPPPQHVGPSRLAAPNLGLEAPAEFFLSTRASIGGNILMNFNTSTLAFYETMRLDQLVMRHYANGPVNLERFLRGVQVGIRYLNNNSIHNNNGPRIEMVHKITGLPFTHQISQANNVMFNSIAVRQYFPTSKSRLLREIPILTQSQGTASQSQTIKLW